jgi:DNA-directed RNA polymerase subunit RPC12/RpoP
MSYRAVKFLRDRAARCRGTEAARELEAAARTLELELEDTAKLRPVACPKCGAILAVDRPRGAARRRTQ